MISRDEAELVMDEVFDECRRLRTEGQKEYAHDEANALANFERVAKRIGSTREQVLSVYMAKHDDGIDAWIKGHRSQREPVYGRIADKIVYLCLLWCMAKDDERRATEDPEVTA